jgi:hypothetical protein
VHFFLFVAIFVCNGYSLRFPAFPCCLCTFAVLSDRVAELNTALGRTGLRMESVETTSRQLGESCESSRVVQGNCYSEAVIVVFLVLLKRNNAVPIEVFCVLCAGPTPLTA